jgi:uncharacterized membrane protein
MALTKLWQKKVLLIAVGITVITGFWVTAQQSTPRPSVDRGSVEERFNYILKEASTFEDSKVVKGWWLYHLKTHVIDTMKSLQNEIARLNGSVSAKSSNYDSLNAELKRTNDKLALAISEKNSISFVGIPMNKNAYNTLLWSIIGGLTFLLVIFIILFKRSNIVTVQTKKDLDELKNEFEVFRKRALEREEKLVRKHHDEMQKYKNT